MNVEMGLGNGIGLELSLDMKLQHRTSIPVIFSSDFTGTYKSEDQFSKFWGRDPNYFRVPGRNSEHPPMALFEN